MTITDFTLKIAIALIASLATKIIGWLINSLVLHFLLRTIVYPPTIPRYAQRHLGGDGDMLQIIGWILCLALFVKGLEILANPAYRKNEGGEISGVAQCAVAFAIIGAIIFAVILYFQGKALTDTLASPSLYGLSDSTYVTDHPAGVSNEELIRSAEETAKAADDAAAAAEAAANEVGN